MLTEKENFMRVIRGEVPAWVPRFGSIPDPFTTKPSPAKYITPSVISMRKPVGGGKVDIFGVPYTAVDSMGGAELPTPNKFILKDILKWRDVIKTPDLSDVDFEILAKNDLEASKANHEEHVIYLGTHVGYFQQLMNFMGFTEGLCAMHEEPEAVLELFTYLADFYDDILRKSIPAYKPDLVCITDDTCTAQNPFISPDMYRKLVKPFHARMAKIILEAGLPVMMHCCGRCEDFIEDWRDFGVTVWNPAQTQNDLEGIKKKYGNGLVLVGCWDSQGPVGWDNADEEQVRAAVRECIDKYAPGGGFIFWGTVDGPKDSPTILNRQKWITTEYEAYRAEPYK